MHSHPGQTHFSLVISIVVAISIHIVIFASLYALLVQSEPPIQRTVKSIILNPSVAQQSTQENATANTTSNRNLVSTVSESDNLAPLTSKPAVPEQKTTTPHPNSRTKQSANAPAQQHRPYQTPLVSIPTNSSLHHKAPNQQQLSSMFQQTATNQTETTNQLATKSAPELSDYEKALLTKLSQETLYDEFHPLMLYNTKTQVDYILSLRLFNNGAIRSATLVKSSGIAEIDRLAIQTAYQASPYPAPPAKDAAIEFRYQIPIIYDRLKLIDSSASKKIHREDK